VTQVGKSDHSGWGGGGEAVMRMRDLFAASPGAAFSPRQLVCEVL
jgi:hypothetical protein